LAREEGLSEVQRDLKQKLKSSVGGVLSADGSTTSGSGNTRYTFQGAPLYHESNGAGKTGGVLLFYVKRSGDVAKIVVSAISSRV
jgi:hypothetical protein